MGPVTPPSPSRSAKAATADPTPPQVRALASVPSRRAAWSYPINNSCRRCLARRLRSYRLAADGERGREGDGGGRGQPLVGELGLRGRRVRLRPVAAAGMSVAAAGSLHRLAEPGSASPSGVGLPFCPPLLLARQGRRRRRRDARRHVKPQEVTQGERNTPECTGSLRRGLSCSTVLLRD